MADKTLKINVNDIIELDYLVEEISSNAVTVNNDPSGSLPNKYISKDTYVFDPPESGTYELEINGNTVEIQVTDFLTLDSFEDSNISEYTVDGAGSSISVTASSNQSFDGSISKRYQMDSSASGNPQVITTSGLSNYPSYPTKLKGYLYLTSVENAIWIYRFGVPGGNFKRWI